jgi:hypothetical protein
MIKKHKEIERLSLKKETIKMDKLKKKKLDRPK